MCSMTEVWIRAHGTPIPQGSKTAGITKGGHAFVRDANPRALKDWRETVAQAAWRAMQEGEFKIDALAEPVDLTCYFYFEKPKSNRSKYPTSARVGDTDKLLRAVGDALVDGGAIDDDRYIVQVSAVKLWADEYTRPGVMIYLSTIN